MLTAHNGQLASFVCVMSYVFKFSIAYIHVYNDEKKALDRDGSGLFLYLQ